jgi:GntR family transcriptional regulator
MIFNIDINSGKPVYQQLIDQIKLAVARGRLKPGDRLPSIRDAAVQVRANRNTIARVYSELEREGLISSRPGQGAFISDRGSLISKAEQRRQLLTMIDELLAQASFFNIPREKMSDLFHERLDLFLPATQSTGGKAQ